MRNLFASAAAGALVAVAFSVSASALDVRVGGNDRGGVSARAGQGDTSATVRIGGGGGNVGSVGVTSGGNTGNVGIGSGAGPLVSGASNGNPLNGDSDTDVDVNLGGLLGGLPGGAIPGGPGSGLPGGGVDPDDVAAAVGGMSAGQQAQMKDTCEEVLNMPRRYDPGLVQLCRLLLTL